MSDLLEVITPQRMSYEEYVEWEETQLERHEFHDGEVLAMSGGTGEHSVVNLNIGGELRQRLKGRLCTVFDSNIRVRQAPGRDYVYPDVTVVCGRPVFEPPLKPSHKRHLTLTNPTLIVETLSDSTEAYDRGEKFGLYIDIPTLREYVLVTQLRPRVETLLRGDDGTWSFAFWDGLDAVARLRSLEIDLPLAEVYAGADFGDDASAQAGGGIFLPNPDPQLCPQNPP